MNRFAFIIGMKGDHWTYCFFRWHDVGWNWALKKGWLQIPGQTRLNTWLSSTRVEEEAEAVLGGGGGNPNKQLKVAGKFEGRGDKAVENKRILLGGKI